MLFKLANKSKATRAVWSNGRQVMVSPNETKTVDISGPTAVFVRRCELRGDLLKIETTDEDGKKILEEALTRPQISTGILPTAGKPGPIRDLIAEAEEKDLEKNERKLLEEEALSGLVPAVAEPVQAPVEPQMAAPQPPANHRAPRRSKRSRR